MSKKITQNFFDSNKVTERVNLVDSVSPIGVFLSAKGGKGTVNEWETNTRMVFANFIRGSGTGGRGGGAGRARQGRILRPGKIFFCLAPTTMARTRRRRVREMAPNQERAVGRGNFWGRLTLLIVGKAGE